MCGDWTRICGGDWQDDKGIAGVFFDPPYGVTDRRTSLYHCDSTDIAKDVMEWCRERGRKSSYRIVIAGYEEYQDLVNNHGWRSQSWKTQGGYGNRSKTGNKNREREMLYFSPHCINNTLWK